MKVKKRKLTAPGPPFFTRARAHTGKKIKNPPVEIVISYCRDMT